MKIFLVRLKEYPHLYVGKRNVSYAFVNDREICERMCSTSFTYWDMKDVKKDVECYMVPRNKAKMWSNPKDLKWLHSYCGKFYDPKTMEDVQATFSQYEVEIDDDGAITHIPFDEFVKQ